MIGAALLAAWVLGADAYTFAFRWDTGPELSPAELEATKESLESRLEALGLSVDEIAADPDGVRIVLQRGWLARLGLPSSPPDPLDVVRAVSPRGELGFFELIELSERPKDLPPEVKLRRSTLGVGETARPVFVPWSEDPSALCQWIAGQERSPSVTWLLGKEGSAWFAHRAGSIELSNRLSLTAVAGLDAHSSQNTVSIAFNSEGTKKFAALTERLVGKPLAVARDRLLLTAPLVQEPIRGGKAVITSGYSQSGRVREDRILAALASSAPLPRDLIPSPEHPPRQTLWPYGCRR